MIPRGIESVVKEILYQKKVILIMGAHQVGKTAMLKKLFEGNEKVLCLNGTEADVVEMLNDASSFRINSLLGEKKILILDETQDIEDIELTLKVIADQLPDIQIIATGSSAFKLSNETHLPLSNNRRTFFMFPLSFAELVDHHGLLKEKSLLEHRLVYGSYPEVIMNPGNEKETLRLLINVYLYRDLLMFEGLKKKTKLLKLLKVLAFRVGNEISYNELGKVVGLDNQTVEKYIDLLEKTYVVFRIESLNRNLRKEVSKSRKVFFYDNGIRNALISQFGNIEFRLDQGALWENYLMAERFKYRSVQNGSVNKFFWRTGDQQEIDYLEESKGLFSIWKFDWNPKAKNRFSKSFTRSYPIKKLGTIHPQNVEEFLLPT